MKHDSSAYELFERLYARAPQFIDLLVAETDRQFEDAFTALLERAVFHLETNKRNFETLSEEGLTGVLVGVLTVPGLTVTQETNSNGHVDITIEVDHHTPIRRKLGEAKIYRGGAYHVSGIAQLLRRYTTGRELGGILIFYVRQPDIKGIVDKLKTMLDATRPEFQVMPCVSHLLKWAFVTDHRHSSGEVASVAHIGCNLYIE